MLRLFVLTLKAPEKNASEKLCLLKLSAENNSLTLLTDLSIEANRVTVCHRGFLNISADMKADDFCCNWRFKG